MRRFPVENKDGDILACPFAIRTKWRQFGNRRETLTNVTQLNEHQQLASYFLKNTQ
jgi:hypothetical protein